MNEIVGSGFYQQQQQQHYSFDSGLTFYIPLNTKYVILETFFPATLQQHVALFYCVLLCFLQKPQP